MSSLSDRVAALPPEKRALLEHRLQARRPGAAPQRIPRRGRDEGPLPLSFAQQRLWFLEQLEPGHSFYNLPFVTRLAGPLRVSKLEESLTEIVRRHEALRTTFTTVDGRPTQVIAPSSPLSLSVIDLRGLPESDRDAEASRLTLAEAGRPFDLVQGPLFRASLLCLSDIDHVLLLTLHHIVSDGWSIGVLYRELSALYAALCAGRPSPLPGLPIQYADFALWQRRWLQGEVLELLLSYWKRKLTGMPLFLELPTDRPRPRVQVFLGAAYAVPMAKSLVEGLKTVGRQAGATLFMVLLAAFKVLLFRYSEQTDVVVGCPIANRTRVEVEGLIGFFVNTLVLRTDVSGDPTFGQVLSRVREVTLEALAHQDLPFEKLVEELQPARNLGHNPLFQVMFVLQNTETGGQIGPQQNAPQLSVGTSKFDLTLSVTETADGLMAVFEYNTELFDATTVVSLAQHFQTLLEGAVAQPGRRASELLLLSREERQRLADEWKGTDNARASASCIHELCEAQARVRPDAVAVMFAGQCLTYRELNARANQLARALREHGVGPEVLVGLCLERSPEMVVGLLGILKAGAAYVPLDPTYPTDRLAYMLEDTQAPLLLTQERLASGPSSYQGKVLCLDTDWPRIAAYRDDDVGAPTAPDNLAYVIYTSGSTGRPKGVMVPHRGVCNVAEAQARTFAVEPENRILQFASLSFDASIFEIVMALRAGATLCLASQEVLLPGTPLVEVLREESINVLTVPPSALAVLPAAVLPDLHTLVVAGEVCFRDLVARWAHGRRFFNAYGPTEGSIWATVAECTEDDAPPPIGRPIPNTRAYVLDARLEPVPLGVPGEIYLGGAGVTRGYHGRPDLTAERYLPDPFRGEPGARMYRTGDRARRRPSGDIQFLGRVDQQLKLRGYRIEVREIEASLLRHPAVREVAVAARRTPGGETRLVAYCVPGHEPAPGGVELRAFLQQRLPDFMVPAAFVLLEALPRHENGKLDRRALSAARHDMPGAEEEGWAAPRTATEEALMRIWCEVLELDHVGIHDSFFELGGHSLLATRVMARVNDAFRTDLPLRRLFELPTIAGLAAALDAAKGDETRPREPAITRVARAVVSLPIAPELPE
jgi:amino acid adenylation domain-containing protein